LHEALAKSDVVVMAAPVTDASRKMMGREEFKAMKQGSIFVAVSRGVPTETEALVEALESGHLAAAGLDVTDPEPLADDHPLRTMPNVVITPHIAGPSDHNRERSLTLLKANTAQFVAGRPLYNIVDKKLGY
jgi:phosphoglycerate dehydrogenase-like enzyme